MNKADPHQVQREGGIIFIYGFNFNTEVFGCDFNSLDDISIAEEVVDNSINFLVFVIVSS